MAGGVNLVNGGTISGATSSSLSLTNITTADKANLLSRGGRLARQLLQNIRPFGKPNNCHWDSTSSKSTFVREQQVF
jgi:hypothetical protein